MPQDVAVPASGHYPAEHGERVGRRDVWGD